MKKNEKGKDLLTNMAWVCRDNGNYPEVAMQCTEIAQEYAKREACEFAEWYLLNEKKYYGSIESIYNAWKNYELLKNKDILEKSIYDCDFSLRILYTLKNVFNAKTIKDLIKIKEKDLKRCRNFGKKSQLELKEFLIKNNLKLEL